MSYRHAIWSCESNICWAVIVARSAAIVRSGPATWMVASPSSLMRRSTAPANWPVLVVLEWFQRFKLNMQLINSTSPHISTPSTACLPYMSFRIFQHQLCAEPTKQPHRYTQHIVAHTIITRHDAWRQYFNIQHLENFMSCPRGAAAALELLLLWQVRRKSSRL